MGVHKKYTLAERIAAFFDPSGVVGTDEFRQQKHETYLAETGEADLRNLWNAEKDKTRQLKVALRQALRHYGVAVADLVQHGYGEYDEVHKRLLKAHRRRIKTMRALVFTKKGNARG